MSTKFNANCFTWESQGPAETVRTNETQQKIIDTLRGSTEALTPAQIVDLTGIKNEVIRKMLGRLAGEGVVCRPKYGVYMLSQSSHCHTSDRPLIDVNNFFPSTTIKIPE